MTKILLLSIISLNILLSTYDIVNAYNIDIKENTNQLNTVQCLFEKTIDTCKTVNNVLTCPSINECVTQLLSSQTNNYEVLITPGYYFPSDCPTFKNLELAGKVSFTANNGGQAFFNCNDFPFLNIKLSKNTDIIFNGIILTGYSSEKGGCLNINGGSFGLTSSLTFIRSGGEGCISSKGGGFLYTDIKEINVEESNFINNKVYDGSGGVFLAEKSVLSIVNSTFSNNIIFSKNYFSVGGVGYASTVDVVQSTFIGNGASWYGGCFYTTVGASITHSLFKNNTAGTGGVLETYGVSNIPTISDSVFVNNSAKYGGVFDGNGGIIRRCKFINNHAYSSGEGGVFSVTAEYDREFSVDSSIFIGNSANEGGAIKADSMVITNSVFIDNFAYQSEFKYSPQTGGAIFTNSYNNIKAYDVFITNTTFTNNRADYGGAIYNTNNNLDIQGSTFTNNRAGNGGSIQISNFDGNQNISITNSTFLDNSCDFDGGAISMERKKGIIHLNLLGSYFSNNKANQYGGAVYFNILPNSFIGGTYSNSTSSEPDSMTFYSKPIEDVNIVSFSNSLSFNYIPIFFEQSFNFWKAFGAKGSCLNGVAVIDENGKVIHCKYNK